MCSSAPIEVLPLSSCAGVSLFVFEFPIGVLMFPWFQFDFRYELFLIHIKCTYNAVLFLGAK